MRARRRFTSPAAPAGSPEPSRRDAARAPQRGAARGPCTAQETGPQGSGGRQRCLCSAGSLVAEHVNARARVVLPLHPLRHQDGVVAVSTEQLVGGHGHLATDGAVSRWLSAPNNAQGKLSCENSTQCVQICHHLHTQLSRRNDNYGERSLWQLVS